MAVRPAQAGCVLTNRPPHPVTPDGRYFVVDGRLWRMTNPHLPADVRERLTKRLMRARRDVGQALRAKDQDAVRRARRRVHSAKLALGERGDVWWTDGEPDVNRRLARNTPYAAWWTKLEKRPKSRSKKNSST